jgi:hypothetical protein
VSHFVDGYVWHVSVKCDGCSVNLAVYFGFILLWQPNMQKIVVKRVWRFRLETAAST